MFKFDILKFAYKNILSRYLPTLFFGVVTVISLAFTLVTAWVEREKIKAIEAYMDNA